MVYKILVLQLLRSRSSPNQLSQQLFSALLLVLILIWAQSWFSLLLWHKTNLVKKKKALTDFCLFSKFNRQSRVILWASVITQRKHHGARDTEEAGLVLLSQCLVVRIRSFKTHHLTFSNLNIFVTWNRLRVSLLLQVKEYQCSRGNYQIS